MRLRVNLLITLFSIVVGFFVAEALKTGNDRLAFGAIVIFILSFVMRWQGRKQLADQVGRMVDEAIEETKESEDKKEG